MKTRIPLDIYDDRPGDMKAYLKYYGWHFNKKMCRFAVSLMRKTNPATGNKEKIEPLTKDKVDEVLSKYGIKLDNNALYDYVYVANMCKADLFKSSVPDEAHLALYIKDTIDDPDAPDGTAMRRWYATMVGGGEPVDWEYMLEEDN